jgi:hypothetical protein
MGHAKLLRQKKEYFLWVWWSKSQFSTHPTHFSSSHSRVVRVLKKKIGLVDFNGKISITSIFNYKTFLRIFFCLFL